MSIRARIALLAFVAILSVVAALFAQYQTIRGEVNTLRQQKTDYEQAQSQSRLVHVLQKERGLSAAMLASPASLLGTELRKQYAETDATLTQVQALELHEKLQAFRQQVASRKIAWVDAREFYTSIIKKALDMIAIGAVTEKSANTRMLAAVVELALARENMGLIRATVNSIYARGADELDDVTFIAGEYGKFQEHLHAFKRDLSSQEPKVAMDDLLTSKSGTVIGQVEAILQRGAHSVTHGSNSLWWVDATHVIDNLKAKEDSLYDNLLQLANSEIEKKELELQRYGAIAVGLGAAVVLLTAFTIIRILRALGVLITTLDDVVRSENYSIRIPGESPKDEFGRISLSLNNLLDFTDTLLIDKEKLAAIDLLTGVLNRRSIMELATREISRADRYASHFVLIFIDIDYFKLINDNYGHAAGDEALINFVHVLKTYLREADLLARWGGEEFVILAPETNLEQGWQLADKLCAEAANFSFPAVGKITCSMGVAESRYGETFDALCQRADVALYQAKETGRNRACRAVY